MSITNKLNQIKNAIYGKEVRGAIHDAIKQVYDDASVNHDNANMEVKMARGTHNTLNDRLDNVDEIQAQTNAQLSDIQTLSKYKYLGTTFSAKHVDDPNTYLRVLLSDDGINWVMYSEYNEIAIRDPYVFKNGDFYYITGTNLLTHDKVGYLRTVDFKKFEHIQYDHTGLVEFEYKWAPSVFNVGCEYYMIMSLSETDSVYGLNHYISKLDKNLVPTTWVKLTGGDIPEWSYDGHIIPTKNAFYFYFKREGGMDLLKSDSLLGAYKKVDTIDSDNGNEAPYIIKTDVNTLRLYVDKWEGEGQIHYKETYDDGVTWTEAKPILIKDGDFIPKHMHVIEIDGDNWQPSFNYAKYDKITTKWGIVQCNNDIEDLNDISSGGYLNRMFRTDTNNLPNNIDDNEYGSATLINMQNNNYIQILNFLSQKQFIRSYVDGTWSTYKIVALTEDNNEFYNTFNIEIGNCTGDVQVNYRCVRDIRIVSIQGRVRGITNVGVTTIGKLDERYRPKFWVQQLAVNVDDWEKPNPIIEVMMNGEINIGIRGTTNISPTDNILFNVMYII